MPSFLRPSFKAEAEVSPSYWAKLLLIVFLGCKHKYEHSTWNAGLDIGCFANSKLKLKKRRSEGWEAHRFSDHEVVCQPETDAAICQESLATPLLILFKLHPHHDLSYGLDIHLEADHHHHPEVWVGVPLSPRYIFIFMPTRLQGQAGGLRTRVGEDSRETKRGNIWPFPPVGPQHLKAITLKIYSPLIMPGWSTGGN